MLRHLIAVALVACIGGCCSQGPLPATGCLEKPGIPGLCETQPFDKALKQLAIGLPLQGKISDGEEYVVTKPLVVYRVWDKSREYSQYGSWWTFERPDRSLDDWRHKFVVCSKPEWGAHNVLSKCRLKVGTKIVIGPGQTMKCNNETISASLSTQVFIPNKLVNDEVYVERCENHVWP